MNNMILYIDIRKLRAHEKTDRFHLMELTEEIKSSGIIKNPVVAEKRHLIILDGHHRVAALKNLRANKVPVFLVDYLDPKIRVLSRRSDVLNKNIKAAVINRVLANKLFPSKTTRHLIEGRPANINVRISKLY